MGFRAGRKQAHGGTVTGYYAIHALSPRSFLLKIPFPGIVYAEDGDFGAREAGHSGVRPRKKPDFLAVTKSASISPGIQLPWPFLETDRWRPELQVWRPSCLNCCRPLADNWVVFHAVEERRPFRRGVRILITGGTR